MSHLVEKLAAEGCDMKLALERFLKDEALYEEFYQKLIKEKAFEDLGAAIKAGDSSAAFENAHSLKGTIGNMGITPMYKLICEIVEPLRVGSFDGIPEKYEQLIKLRAHFGAFLE